MSVEGPSGKKPGRLSPEELAGEVARRLRLDRGGHRRRRFDMVTAGRIAMVLGIVLFGVGTVFAATWIGRLTGFETTGVVIDETPVYGCPGEPQLGVVFSGETVQLVGRSDDGVWFALRDERGPGDVVYADAVQISPGEDHERLPVRDCVPRSEEEIAAEQTTVTSAVESTTTVATVPTTTVPGATTTSSEATRTPGRPPRRATPSPGTTTTTTTQPASPTTTTRATTTTTRATTSTTSGTTTSSTAGTTTTTQSTTTTTAEPSTTSTTEATTTSSTEATTSTTEATTTSSSEPLAEP